MKQLVQSVRSGDLRLVDIPAPQLSSTEVLVATSCSLVSAGTERAVRRLASASLVTKARARPELVRQVVRKARVDGLRPTIKAVRTRLDDEMPLGYSGAGTVLEVGEAVAGLRPGDRVATGGAGHAEIQSVAGLLAARIPDGVTDAEAAFATVGSVALHGLRLAEVGPGARVVVVGLGLVGQLTARLARAAGCEVAGIDVSPWPVERARDTSVDLALLESGADTTAAVVAWSGGTGADAVIVTAATSSSDPMRRSPDLARDRATLVLVGDVGLELDRRPLYDKELSVKVARSYGPGRYEQAYEEWGVDYPPGQVRWTEGRNQDAVLGLLARGRLSVDDLITHRFSFDQALDAYELLESDVPSLGIELLYGEPPAQSSTPIRISARSGHGPGVGLLGAGAFARGVLVPALAAAGFERLVSVTSTSGLSAVRLAERAGFERAAPSAEAVIADPDVDVVVIATRHDTHAALAARALRSGRHVFCEKPLALTVDELADVEDAWRSSGRQLAVGFNRRFSAAIQEARRRLSVAPTPLVIDYRVNAGPIGGGNWYGDRRQGGRLLGEVCHFVDTCAALAGERVSTVCAQVGSATDALTAADVVIAARLDGGSLASITYASGGSPSTPKERIEFFAAGHTFLIDDFRSLVLDGKTIWSGPQDKGHVALLSAFADSVRHGAAPAATEEALATSRAVIAAVASAISGLPAAVTAIEATP
jgi:predicted dehydrogenase/threonine dehydrogenase-like Zn-dependent dehydrogenase